MLMFWLLAAALAGLAAMLILLRAARAERSPAPADPSLEVYRRQLGEIDELAGRGLLGGDELKAARAEAARRLIRQSDLGPPPAAAPGPDRRARAVVLAAALLAPMIALGGYLLVGSPGLPDEPFTARLRAWRHTDPTKLGLPQMDAVLQSIVAERPKDPQPLVFLARVQLGEGDVASAVRSLQKAADLAPNDAGVWARLGEALTIAGKGEVTDDARSAFARAAALDPSTPGPRYMLARADIAAGHAAEGVQKLRAILAGLPAGDPNRAALQAEIDHVAKTGRLPPGEAETPQAGAPAADQAAFIQSMVARLAARLNAQPDDPAGWARLIRAYGVLGETRQQQDAVARARVLFKDRPDALRTALSGQAAPPP